MVILFRKGEGAYHWNLGYNLAKSDLICPVFRVKLKHIYISYRKEILGGSDNAFWIGIILY